MNETMRDEILQTIDQKISNLEDTLRDLKSQRNEEIPISSLPPEILSKIFIQYASFFDTVNHSPLPWIKVTHVCRHWRDVAINCPYLWTNLPLYRPHWVQEMLVRSKNAGLIVKADLASLPERLAETLSTALHQLSRIKHLELRASQDMAQRFLKDFLVAAPRLEILSLTASSELFTIESKLILPNCSVASVGGTLRLQNLQLDGVHLDWDSPLLWNGLTHFKFAGLQTHSGTIVQMLSALNQMPALISLELSGRLFILRAQTQEAPNCPSVYLPHLANLTITTFAEECECLLEHLTFPLNCAVQVKCTRGPEGQNYIPLFGACKKLLKSRADFEVAPTSGASARHLFQTLRIKSGSTMGLEAWDTNPSIIDVELQRKAPRVSLLFPYLPTMLNDWIPIACELSAHNIRQLIVGIGFNDSDIGESGWKCLMQHLPKVQAVYVGCETTPSLMNTLLHNLGNNKTLQKVKQRNIHPLIPEVYFPRLQTLDIRYARFGNPDLHFLGNPDYFNNLLDLLMLRYEYKAEIQQLALTECYYMHQERIELLEQIVVNVEWDGEDLEDEEEEEEPELEPEPEDYSFSEFDDEDDYDFPPYFGFHYLGY